MSHGALTAAAFALALGTGEGAMASGEQAERALSLAAHEADGQVHVVLTGHAPRAMRVSYELELRGSSTSRHRGATALVAHHETVLSRMSMSAADGWCVRASVTEDGGAPYELAAGSCA